MSRSFMKNIMVIARCATLYRDKQLTECGLNGYQAPYLPEICANPGITQDQLALLLHVNRSSVTRQLALLEENGFIDRKRSQSDRRAVEVYPTDKGTQVLPVIRQTFRSWRQALTADVTEEQLHAVEEVMDLLAQRAEEIL